MSWREASEDLRFESDEDVAEAVIYALEVDSNDEAFHTIMENAYMLYDKWHDVPNSSDGGVSDVDFVLAHLDDVREAIGIDPDYLLKPDGDFQGWKPNVLDHVTLHPDAPAANLFRERWGIGKVWRVDDTDNVATVEWMNDGSTYEIPYTSLMKVGKADWREVTAQDYHMQHRPSEGAPLSDITRGGIIPDDVFTNPHYYTGFAEMLPETMAAIDDSHGNPDNIVTIYRSAPEGVETFNHGDWVTLSRAYAELHGTEQNEDGSDWPVIDMQVPASDVHFAGDDLMEWGYFPGWQADPDEELEMALDGFKPPERTLPGRGRYYNILFNALMHAVDRSEQEAQAIVDRLVSETHTQDDWWEGEVSIDYLGLAEELLEPLVDAIQREQGRTAAVKTADEHDTDQVLMFIDNDPTLHKEVASLIRMGMSPADLAEWGEKVVLAVSQATAEWMDDPDADLADYMIDPAGVDWQEIWERVVRRVREEASYQTRDVPDTLPEDWRTSRLAALQGMQVKVRSIRDDGGSDWVDGYVIRQETQTAYTTKKPMPGVRVMLDSGRERWVPHDWVRATVPDALPEERTSAWKEAISDDLRRRIRERNDLRNFERQTPEPGNEPPFEVGDRVRAVVPARSYPAGVVNLGTPVRDGDTGIVTFVEFTQRLREDQKHRWNPAQMDTHAEDFVTPTSAPDMEKLRRDQWLLTVQMDDGTTAKAPSSWFDLSAPDVLPEHLSAWKEADDEWSELTRKIYDSFHEIADERDRRLELPVIPFEVGDRVRVRPLMRQGDQSEMSGTISRLGDEEHWVEYDQPVLNSRGDELAGGYFWPSEIVPAEVVQPDTLPWSEDEQDYYRRASVKTSSAQNWVFVNGHVEFGTEPLWEIARKAAIAAGLDETATTRVSNMIARKMKPTGVACAVGTVEGRYPRIWMTNADRNTILDAVLAAL